MAERWALLLVVWTALAGCHALLPLGQGQPDQSAADGPRSNDVAAIDGTKNLDQPGMPPDSRPVKIEAGPNGDQLQPDVTTKCDSITCAGCCAAGQCVPLGQQSSSTCGAAGELCKQCGTGQSCLSGVCTCDVAKCPAGCCDTAGVCRPGNTSQYCGAKGVSCQTCASGYFKCISGFCLAVCVPPCSATECCDEIAEKCVTGDTPTLCGKNGMICKPCSGGQVCCDNGSCKFVCP